MRVADYRWAGAALLAAAITLTGCVRSEQPLLGQFFDASRLRDTTALQSVATTIFEPREQGIVREFQITSVTPERRNGAATTKDVTLDARVALPDGGTVQKTLVVTMERDESRGRWMVTGVRDARAK